MSEIELRYRKKDRFQWSVGCGVWFKERKNFRKVAGSVQIGEKITFGGVVVLCKLENDENGVSMELRIVVFGLEKKLKFEWKY